MSALELYCINLNNKLLAASEAYYKKNTPIMLDVEFDAMERELKELVSANPNLTPLATILISVGNDQVNPEGKIPHNTPMLSIENNYEESTLLSWYEKLPPDTKVCLEPKFDGISCSLVYKNYKLHYALTRGDGKYGENITAQVMAVTSIPKTLPKELPAEIEIRGELAMRNSTLERLNDEVLARGVGKIYTSTRNLTGGTMKLKSKDTSVITSRDILLFPWDVLCNDLPDSGLERLKQYRDALWPRRRSGS